MTTQVSADRDTKRAALERRFEGFGWGVLLITVGAIWLLPEKQVPHGSLLIAAGLIMVGLNAARLFSGLRISAFSLIVGILALIAGLGEHFGTEVPLFPIALIVIGGYSLVKALRHEHSGAQTDHGWNCCGPCAGGK